MAALSESLSYLYTMTTVFFTLLIFQLLISFRSFAGNLRNLHSRRINTAQYLQLIEEKNPTVRYKTNLLWPHNHEMECIVCLSNFNDGEEMRKLKCKHTFHKDCLDKWLIHQDSATCPLCRREILPEETVSRYRRRQYQSEYDGSDEELIFLLSALSGNNFHRVL